MKIVIQRVSHAAVEVEGQLLGSIQQGLLLLVGVGPEDGLEDIAYLKRKILQMRIFEDEEGKMNRSLLDVGGAVLSISQFTLFAQTKKGNRPSYTQAAPPQLAEELYLAFNEALAQDIPLEAGRFGADMKVSLVNDGPVTILLDSKNP